MGIQSELNNILRELDQKLNKYKRINHQFVIEQNDKTNDYEIQIKLWLKDSYLNLFCTFVYRYNDNISVDENVKNCIEEYKNEYFSI